MHFYEYIEKRTGIMFCNDCHANIRDIKEYDYMLHNNIWGKVGKKEHLCIGCLEKRLGRKLGPNDFDWSLPINWDNAPRSERLLDRMFEGQ